METAVSSFTNTSTIQESPPAWTQEAYCPLCSHSKCLLFPGGTHGTPRPEMGYSLTWDGVSPQTWDGVSPLDLRWGTPPDLRWGTPQTWDGVPPDLGWVPPSKTWDGVPPQTWDRVPLLPTTETGTPYPELRWGTPPMWTDWTITFPHPSDGGQ